MFSLTFTLRQHTPIIHFQHEQEGATLRATEVKPKLDRFILMKLGKEALPNSINSEEIYKKGIELAKEKRWLLGDKPALDYKMRVEAGEKIEDLSVEIEKEYTSLSGRAMPEKFPAFFGLMGEENKGTKEFVMYEKVEISILTSCSDLFLKIKENINSFFMANNFGNRQSKGFGSFYIDSNDKIYKSHDLQNIKLPYWFDVEVNPQRKSLKAERSVNFKAQFELFETINLFYASLRSGINLYAGKDKPVLYLKSMLFLYAKSQGIQWEKKKIKETFYFSELNNQKKAHPQSDILEFSGQQLHLMRDIFGLASDSEWYSYKDTISKASSEVERYKSPLHFKPINLGNNRFRVYFDTCNENEGIYNQLFSIISKKQRQSFSIKTPMKFSFNAFFKFAFSQNLNEIAKYPSSFPPKELVTLQKIYKHLASNIPKITI